MFGNEVTYGESLKVKGLLKPDVVNKMADVRVWYDMYGNPNYSFWYKGSKAVLWTYYGEIRARIATVARKKDL